LGFICTLHFGGGGGIDTCLGTDNGRDHDLTKTFDHHTEVVENGGVGQNPALWKVHDMGLVIEGLGLRVAEIYAWVSLQW
jgi:hypothetical protein